MPCLKRRRKQWGVRRKRSGGKRPNLCCRGQSTLHEYCNAVVSQINEHVRPSEYTVGATATHLRGAETKETHRQGDFPIGRELHPPDWLPPPQGRHRVLRIFSLPIDEVCTARRLEGAVTLQLWQAEAVRFFASGSDLRIVQGHRLKGIIAENRCVRVPRFRFDQARSRTIIRVRNSTWPLLATVAVDATAGWCRAFAFQFLLQWNRSRSAKRNHR
jgi:hypothetical protein